MGQQNAIVSDDAGYYHRCSIGYHSGKYCKWLYELYAREGFAPIKELWESFAISVGKMITATTPQKKIVGEALGITDDGVLLMKDAQGVIHSIYSADIEL